jgi:hypothetical protein
VALGGVAAVWLLAGGPQAAPPAAPAPDAGALRGPTHVVEQPSHATPELAQALPALPVEVAGVLGPGEIDWYRATVPDGHLVLDAWVEAPAGVRVRVRRPEGGELAAATAPARVAALGVTAGPYLIAVDGPAGGYRLHVHSATWARGEDWEPDDQPEQAQPMASLPAGAGELARFRAAGRWSRPDDVDCFVVPLAVPADGAVVRLELRPPPAVTAELWVLDSGNPAARVPRTRLAEARGAAAGAPVVVPALGGRSWESSYVVCTRARAGFDPGQRYLLEVRMRTPRGPFEFEPNDERERASALPRDLALEGYLTTGDVDWFRVSAGRGPVRVTASPPTGVAVELRLLDGGGQELARAQAAPGAPVTATAAATFVRVAAIAGGDVTATYRIDARSVAGATP